MSLANNYGATPMSLAAEVGNTDMLKLLLEAGANADSPNPDGQTALLAVARTGNVTAAQLLLDHGATVDAREKWGGQTALMWASARRHPEMMQLLISKGADVNARSIDRNYQRHVTAEGRPKNLDSGGLTPLLYAARENCMACVEVLLKNGADIDLPDPDGVSPLLVAIMNANWDLARQLILAGADVNQWDIFGEAPLFTAIDLRSRIDGGRASIDPLNKTNGLTIVNAAPRARRRSEHAAVLQAGERAGHDQYTRLHAARSARPTTGISRSSSCCWNMAPTPLSTWRTGRRRSMRCSRAAPRSHRRWN